MIETKKLILFSLNESEYPNLEIECRVVKELKELVLNYILNKKANPVNVAKKTALITARLGVVGEKIDTRPRVERDGKIYVIGETMATVKIEGSMIVCNPDGEEYIVKPDAFTQRYAATKNKNEYLPISKAIKYLIIKEDIVFEAPWGGDMFAVKGAALNITSLNDIYAIQNESFKKTYQDICLPAKIYLYN